MSVPNYDEWTIDHWRLEPRAKLLDIDPAEPDSSPAFWKDVTTAALLAVALWLIAVVVFR